MTEPAWVTADEVIRLNRALVAATGEPFLVREQALLDGAIERPAARYHYENITDVCRLAVITIQSVAMAHAFEQGNKRAAWAAGRLFLRKNGYNISPSVEEQKKLAEMVKRMIGRKRQSTRDRYFDYLLNAIYDLLRLSL